MEFGLLTGQIIGAAIRVHNALGPGLLESAYQPCFAYEMARQGLRFTAQWPIPVIYDGVHLDCGYKADFLVENEVIVEIKAVPIMRPVFEAQLLSYMKLSGIPTGLLINFHELRLRDGIRRLTLKV
jgi:GxxExxY protein